MTYRLFIRILSDLAPFFACAALYAQSSEKQEGREYADSLRRHSLDEVVITASKTSESILRSPVSIETAGSIYLKNSASVSFFDALENVKGVQMITASLGFKIINTRGFANTTNVRFTQLVDGFDNQAPHIGAPIGNALGPVDLDIERVEILPGTASALYGLSAVNGLANLITKNPFKSEGIAFQQKTGVNHLGEGGGRASLFSESSFRAAKKFSEYFALKFNFSFTTGQDWIADNRDDLNASANTGVGIAGGKDNPGYDPVNGYGNESSNRRTLTLQGKRYVVARTGYWEEEVTDYDIQNIKGDIGLYYKTGASTMFSYTCRFADLDNVYHRANRFALKDYLLLQHTFEIKNDLFQFRFFLTDENTGRSYNLRSAAENMDRRFKTDDKWYADFTSAFNTAMGQAGTAAAQALIQARQSADQGRLQPGTPAFDQALKELADINNWDQGAALRVKDKLLRGEAQIDISKIIGQRFREKTGLELLGGADYQSYIIDPDGNYFINPKQGETYEAFSYGRTGGFLQAGRGFMKELLKLSATLRVDKNDYFDAKLNVRFAAVVSPASNHSIRMSYQSGYRFPTIFEAFSNVNSGGVRRVGGLRVMSDGVFENAYLRSSVDRFQAAVTNNFNSNGVSLAQAIENQKGLLVKNYYTYLEPEHINSFEAGYKGILFGKTLKADADFYFNKYDNFIAQIEMNVPNTSDPALVPAYMNNRSQQSRYRIYTNSNSVVYNYGASLGLTYLLGLNYTITGNVTYAKLSRTENNDGFEDGFNTPEWIANVSFGGEKLFDKLGYMLTCRYQSGFYWRSFLVNGDVQSYVTLDAQVNYEFLQKRLRVKLGASNLLNHYYNSFLGGPAIGGLYYTALTYQL